MLNQSAQMMLYLTIKSPENLLYKNSSAISKHLRNDLAASVLPATSVNIVHDSPLSNGPKTRSGNLVQQLMLFFDVGCVLRGRKTIANNTVLLISSNRFNAFRSFILRLVYPGCNWIELHCRLA
jgi:hypothetical protein